MMTEEEKMMKRLSDLFSRETPQYTHAEVENSIRGMITNMLDHLEKSNNTLQKP